MGPVKQLERWLGLAVGILLCGLALWQFSWLGSELADPIQHGRNEDWDWQLSLYEVSRLALAGGDGPFWNPYTQGGVPLWANPEAPFFYPPFGFILLAGTDAGIKIWIAFHLVLLVVGGWVAGREMGLCGVGAHGAALAVFCSAFVPGFLAVGHIMYLPLGWLPLAWVAVRRGRWALGGGCLALSFLGTGHYLLIYGALWLVMEGLLAGLVSTRLWVLAGALACNGLMLGQSWAAWPLGLALVAALCWQRPLALKSHLWPVVGAGVLAVLLCGVKLATAPALFAQAERLVPQVSVSIADEYTLGLAWDVMRGGVDRLSGHEGQNVFWSGIPLVLGWVGLLGLARTRPAVGVMGLLWWNLGWGGATPVNLLEGLHRVPGLDYLRVVERYSLVWTLFLGWGIGWVVTRARHRFSWPGLAVSLLALGPWLHVAIPEAAKAQRLGPGVPLLAVPGEFAQTEGEGTNYASIRANQGRIDLWTTAWLETPSAALSAVGRPDYKGEAWLATDGSPLPVRVEGSRISVELEQAGRVVINQNAFAGWRVNDAPAGDHKGLLSADLPAGSHVFTYRPPGFGLGLLLTLLGVLAWIAAEWRRAGGSRSSGTGPRPGMGPPSP